ncbi:hypothetical protein M885DRAFT_175121 [Pelagophyceae sp. CCMP2097]|nr:hypothetical protein M885DRAFT_175121 [Pelagophyceae sp. CCMP2097]
MAGSLSGVSLSVAGEETVEEVVYFVVQCVSATRRWSLRKRYSEFDELRKAVSREVGSTLQPFPGKQMLKLSAQQVRPRPSRRCRAFDGGAGARPWARAAVGGLHSRPRRCSGGAPASTRGCASSRRCSRCPRRRARRSLTSSATRPTKRRGALRPSRQQRRGRRRRRRRRRGTQASCRTTRSRCWAWRRRRRPLRRKRRSRRRRPPPGRPRRRRRRPPPAPRRCRRRARPPRSCGQRRPRRTT